MGVNGLHKGFSYKVVLSFLNLVGALGEDCQVLSHITALDGVNNGLLKSLREESQLLILVKLGAVHKTTSPCED